MLGENMYLIGRNTDGEAGVAQGKIVLAAAVVDALRFQISAQLDGLLGDLFQSGIYVLGLGGHIYCDDPLSSLRKLTLKLGTGHIHSGSHGGLCGFHVDLLFWSIVHRSGFTGAANKAQDQQQRQAEGPKFFHGHNKSPFS